MAHRLTVKPVRLRERNPNLAADVLRVVGYRASCSCGWRSPVRPTVRAARAELSAHAH